MDLSQLAEWFDSGDLTEFEHSEEVVAAKMELAEQAADYARSIAPEDEGDYKDGIRAARYGDDVYVEFSDPQSYLIEYGTEDTPEFAVRARTETHFNG